MHQIFVLIRFSLYIKDGFTKKTPLDELYSEERLNKRFELFESICLPSLYSQNETITIVVMVSKGFPNKFLSRLHNYKNVHVVILNENDDFTDNRIVLKDLIDNNSKLIATVKLDDDDALHPSFSSKIQEYMDKSSTKQFTLVSFPHGCQYVYSSKKCKECNIKLIACGLTLISPSTSKYNVYNDYYAKGTAKLNNKIQFRIIFDNTSLMYLIADHTFNHSYRGIWDKSTHIDDDLLKRIMNEFSFISCLKKLNN